MDFTNTPLQTLHGLELPSDPSFATLTPTSDSSDSSIITQQSHFLSTQPTSTASHEAHIQVKTELPDTPPRTPPLVQQQSLAPAAKLFTSTTSQPPTILQGFNGFKIVLPANGSLISGTQAKTEKVASTTGLPGVQKMKVQCVKPVAPIQPKAASATATTCRA